MKNIDDIFKKLGDNAGMEYQDSYWSDMEKMLDKRSQKKRFIYWRIAAVVLILVTGLTLLWPLFDKHENASESTSVYTIESKNTPELPDAAADKNTVDLAKTEPKKPTQSSTNINQSAANKRVESVSNSTVPDTKPELQVSIPNPVATVSNPAIIPSEPAPDPVVKRARWNPFPIRILHMALGQLQMLFAIPLASNPLLSKKTEDKTGKEKGVFADLALSQNQMLGKSGSNPYRNMESKKSTLGVNLGLRLQKGNWYAKSGLGLQQFEEENNYILHQKYYTTETSYVMVNREYGYTPFGSTLSLIKKRIDSTQHTTSVIPNPNNTTRFTYLNIPIQIGFMAHWNSFHLFAETGLNAGILLHKKGFYPTWNGNDYEIMDISVSKDLNPVVLSTAIALGLQVDITKLMAIRTAVTYAKSLNSMVKSYSQRTETLGAQIGLQIQLK